MTRRLLIADTLYVAGSVSLGAVSHWLDTRVAERTGLIRLVESQAGSGEPSPISSRARTIDLDFLEEDPDAPRRNFSVRWSGLWYLRATKGISA